MFMGIWQCWGDREYDGAGGNNGDDDDDDDYHDNWYRIGMTRTEKENQYF